jgi:hypothetical protein
MPQYELNRDHVEEDVFDQIMIECFKAGMAERSVRENGIERISEVAAAAATHTILCRREQLRFLKAALKDPEKI